MTTYANPQWLVETDWLAVNLDNPALRIFDCAAQPGPNPDEEQRKKYPLSPQPACAIYEENHIPSAGYIDVPNDLTDQSSDIPMMLASTEQLVRTFRQAGISDDSHVVLYSSTGPIWATRVWCVLRSLGFDNVAVLNGGLKKWMAEGRAVSSALAAYPQGSLDPTPHEGGFIGKDRVRAALDDDNVLIIHALTPSVYDGSNNKLIFGRRGHIPGSINIPSSAMQNEDSGTYLPAEALQELFENANAHKARQIITYCGGGINASTDAFVLALLGYDNVSIYDGSMCEWGNDDTLPIEIN